jgi:hypothetical protein
MVFWITVVTNRSTRHMQQPMGDSNRWWRWFVSGYRANRLVSARAIDQDQAEYVADLYRRDGVRNVQVKHDG